MKTIKQCFNLVPIIGFMFCLSVGFAQQDQNILGTWTFDQGPSFARMPSDIKEHTDSIPALKTQILSAFVGRRMTFSPNGDFLQSMSNGVQIVGRWALQGNQLLLIDPENNVYRQTIAELKQNRLVLLAPTNGETRPVLPELYFTKN